MLFVSPSEPAAVLKKSRPRKCFFSSPPLLIPTKPLQGKGFVYKRARFLGLEGGKPPPPKGQSGHAEDLDTTAQGPAEPARHPAARRKGAPAPAGAGMAALYEQLAFGCAPRRGRGAPGRAGGSGPGT